MTMLTLALSLLGGVVHGGGDDPALSVEVQCRPQALVRGTEVWLRDLADVHCSDPRVAERLARVSFGRRPARGFTRVLAQAAIKNQLALEGVPVEHLEIGGAREVLVQSLHAVLQPHELLEVAEGVVRAAIDRQAGEDIEFETVAKLSAIEVPPGRRSFDLRGRLRNGDMGGATTTVEVAVMVDDEEHRVIDVPFRLTRYGPMVVVQEPIRRETPLFGAGLVVERRELVPGAETLHISDVAAVDGKVAARDLRRGQVLRLADVAEPAIIRPKDPVTLVVRRGSGNVRVAIRAFALDSAARGERCRVATTGNKIVQGIAADYGVVVVPSEHTAGVRR